MNFTTAALLLQTGEPFFLCIVDVRLRNLEIVSGKMGKWELIGFEEESAML